MITIWKYELEETETHVISAPWKEVLCVKAIADIPYIWLLVDTAAPDRELVVHTVGTGHDMTSRYKAFSYVGTYSLYDNTLIFHVFNGSK